MLINNVNPNKLHDELIAKGIIPILVTHDKVTNNIAINTWITFADDVDMTAVQAFIDAHNPEPLPPNLTDADYLLDLDFRLSMHELGL